MRKAKPGRPSLQDGSDASNSIIESACLQFATNGIKGTTNRQIANGAKVTPAMVHYYFRNKDALHRGVLNAAFAPLLETLSGAKTLESWVIGFHSHLVKRPWLPHLMMREVLPPAGQLRPFFLKNYAPHIFGSMKTLVATEAARKKVRADFDLERHVVLLMSMLVYPFLGMDIAHYLTGRKFDEKMFIGFRDDALSLFGKGITARR
jgi:AcrR family transcriptional regulator